MHHTPNCTGCLVFDPVADTLTISIFSYFSAKLAQFFSFMVYISHTNTLPFYPPHIMLIWTLCTVWRHSLLYCHLFSTSLGWPHRISYQEESSILSIVYNQHKQVLVFILDSKFTKENSRWTWFGTHWLSRIELPSSMQFFSNGPYTLSRSRYLDTDEWTFCKRGTQPWSWIPLSTSQPVCHHVALSSSWDFSDLLLSSHLTSSAIHITTSSMTAVQTCFISSTTLSIL